MPVVAIAPDRPKTAIFNAPTLIDNAARAAPARGAATAIAFMLAAIAVSNKAALPASDSINVVNFVIN